MQEDAEAAAWLALEQERDNWDFGKWSGLDISSSGLTHILFPLSGSGKYTVYEGNTLDAHDPPRVSVQAALERVDWCFSVSQFRNIFNLASYVEMYGRREKYQRCVGNRPSMRLLTALEEGRTKEEKATVAHDWWEYTLACVRYDVRKRMKSESWSSIKKKGAAKREYISLFKRKMHGEKIWVPVSEGVRCRAPTMFRLWQRE